MISRVPPVPRRSPVGTGPACRARMAGAHGPTRRTLVVLAFTLAAAGAGLVPPHAWAAVQAPAAAPRAAAPLTKEQMRQFLLTARIVSSASIPKGITHPVRLTLDDGALRHDAAFSTVDEHKTVMELEGGRTEIGFVDSYRYTLAAYGVAELLGIDDMMPVVVEREWHGERGALAWWVDVMMDEQKRLKQKVQPPDSEAWNRQMYTLRVFTQLVADTDRNVGNVLIDPQWKLWMVDFTRAFRRNHQLLNPSDLTRCDRRLMERLRAVTREQVVAKTTPYVGKGEVDALMARRDVIVKQFESLAAANGEAHVLY